MEGSIKLFRKPMTRKRIIAGNWKMHKTMREAALYVEALTPLVVDAGCEVWIAPSFFSISAAAEKAEGSRIRVGAQNMSDQDEGAFTGEVSARMLKEAGAQFVILGHSERRQYFNEVDEHIHHKLKRALLESLLPLLCIGESAAERESGHSLDVLRAQLDGALGDLTADALASLVVAYEPVWAIGTGKSATPEIAQEIHAEIRSYLTERVGSGFAQDLPILYGGSVKPTNIEGLLNQTDIDGALIGGASLDVEAFANMVRQGSKR